MENGETEDNKMKKIRDGKWKAFNGVLSAIRIAASYTHKIRILFVIPVRDIENAII